MSKYKKTAVYILFVLIFGHTLLALGKITSTIAPDFSVYYYSTLDLIHNINPYADTSLFTVFNYPILTNVLYLPFILMSYKFAQCLFIFLSFVSAIGIVYLSFKLLKIRLSVYSFLLVLCMVFSAFPVKFTLGMGQSNLVALFCLMLGFRLIQQRKINFSGILIGIAILLKPILVVFLVYFLFRQFRVFLYAFLLIFTVFLITLIMGKWPLYIYYIQHLAPNLFYLQGKEIYYNQSLLGFLTRLKLDQTVINLSYYLISLTLLTIGTIRIKKKQFNQQIALIFCLFLIINPLSWQHHFVFLIFPFILIRKTFKDKSLKNIITLIIIYSLLSTNIQNPQTLTNFPFSLILSHYLYGTLILFSFLLI